MSNNRKRLNWLIEIWQQLIRYRAGLASLEQFWSILLVGTRQVMKNWTMRPAVAVAGIGQMFEGIAQALHASDLCFEFGNVLSGQFLHLPAGTLPVIPQSQQITDTLDREAKLPGAMYESQPVHVGFNIEPVSAVLARCGGNEAYILIITYHLGRYARCGGRFSDLHPDSPQNYRLTLPPLEGLYEMPSERLLVQEKVDGRPFQT